MRMRRLKNEYRFVILTSVGKAHSKIIDRRWAVDPGNGKMDPIGILGSNWKWEGSSDLGSAAKVDNDESIFFTHDFLQVLGVDLPDWLGHRLEGRQWILGMGRIDPIGIWTGLRKGILTCRDNQLVGKDPKDIFL